MPRLLWIYNNLTSIKLPPNLAFWLFGCTPIHHCFHTLFYDFLAKKQMQKTCCWLFFIPGFLVVMYALYVHIFYFAGSIKFKKDNTSKPRICLHQIGGDCWTRCFDVSKSKWNAWRWLLLVVCVYSSWIC